jgi:hypothetical protein
MNPFDYQRASSTEDAIKSIDGRVAKFLGGGTNLIDLMKLDVEHPATLVDITGLDLTKVEPAANSGLLIGGLVRNSDLANHPQVIEKYPLLSQALLSGASPNYAIWRQPAATCCNVRGATTSLISHLRPATSEPGQRMRRNPGLQSNSRHSRPERSRPQER